MERPWEDRVQGESLLAWRLFCDWCHTETPRPGLLGWCSKRGLSYQEVAVYAQQFGWATRAEAYDNHRYVVALQLERIDDYARERKLLRERAATEAARAALAGAKAAGRLGAPVPDATETALWAATSERLAPTTNEGTAPPRDEKQGGGDSRWTDEELETMERLVAKAAD